MFPATLIELQSAVPNRLFRRASVQSTVPPRSFGAFLQIDFALRLEATEAVKKSNLLNIS